MKHEDFVSQRSINDCGVACLAMMFNINNIKMNYNNIKSKMKVGEEGVSAYDIINFSNKNGLSAVGYKNYDINNFKKPLIAHLVNDNKLQHFVIVLSVSEKKVLIADPSSKIMQVTKKWFDEHYTGVVILFNNENKLSIKSIFKNKKIMISIILITIFLALLNIVHSYALSYLINIIQSGIKNKVIYMILFLFFMLGVIKEVIFLIRNSLSLKFQILIDKTITIPTINKLISLPHHYYQTNGPGSLMSKLNDLSYIKEMISKCVEVLFVNVIFMVFALLAISFINSYFILLNFIIIIIFYVINILFIKYNFFKTYDLQINNEELNNEVADSFNGILTIKNLSKEKYFCEKLNNTYKNVLNKHKNLTSSFIGKDFMQNIIFCIINMLVLLICIINKLDISLIIFIVSLENIITDSVRNIANELPLFMNFKSTYIRINEVFSQKEVNNYRSKINIQKIKYKNVNFKYDNKTIINNVSFDINKKDWIMVTGPSGSGKTTLFKLLTLQDESSGIYLNNKPLNSYKDNDIANSITYVDQKSKLFKDNIKENISLGNNSIEKPVKTALVDQLLKENNLDYNYVIDNTNSNLSGGQIQKIIISRTLCNGSNFIIFDETTSQLDSKTEREVLNNIKKNYPEKTIVLITHRDDNKTLFNKIINVDKGKVRIINNGG